jgi:hypothetical protein
VITTTIKTVNIAAAAAATANVTLRPPKGMVFSAEQLFADHLLPSC